jgi:hypothetical protein
VCVGPGRGPDDPEAGQQDDPCRLHRRRRRALQDQDGELGQNLRDSVQVSLSSNYENIYFVVKYQGVILQKTSSFSIFIDIRTFRGIKEGIKEKTMVTMGIYFLNF